MIIGQHHHYLSMPPYSLRATIHQLPRHHLFRHTGSSDIQAQALTAMTPAVRPAVGDHSHLRYSPKTGTWHFDHWVYHYYDRLSPVLRQSWALLRWKRNSESGGWCLSLALQCREPYIHTSILPAREIYHLPRENQNNHLWLQRPHTPSPPVAWLCIVLFNPPL